MDTQIDPKATWRRMKKEIVSGLFHSRLWLGISSEIVAPVDVKNDYFGVNVATSDEPSCDDYVIDSLQELGLRHVRLNFTYESFAGNGERLLERLLAEQFEVLLNIFPPAEQAARLATDEQAAVDWQQFVEKVFARYHDRIAIFEIGNTPNRKSWSGFEPITYLRAWEIASPLAAPYDIELAGPNVSDFEPIYNIGYLSEMKRLSKVPEVHTDNLFVERVIEPEAYDPRVFGKKATRFLKLNLIKKARIIELLGKQYGAIKTFCTYNCWTVKRLSRRNIDPEQKQADYLTRYLVIAAASGALDEVYWGALICKRDGLIDCGSADYPDYENVTYYRQVRGQVSEFRKRPSFYALKYVIEQLSEARCIQGMSGDNGVHHFIFETEQHETHIVWSKDGYVLPLAAIYSQDLANASFLNQQGEAIAQAPNYITEQPLFIQFAAGQAPNRPSVEQLKAVVDLNKQNITVLPPSAKQFVQYANADWAGAMMFDSGFTQQAVELQILPEQLEQVPAERIFRDTRNKVWNIESDLGMLTVKLNRARGLKKLSYRFLESKGKRHWNNAIHMLRRGIDTPMPVAYFERHQSAGIENNYYVTQFLEGAFSARDVFTSINNGEPDINGLSHDALLKVIAEFVCDMHNAGILHRDLSSGNLLLRKEGDVVKPYLIDIGRARILKNLKTRKRLIDVMRICYKLPWSGREQLMAYYQDSLGKELPYWRLAVNYYVFKQKSKRYIKGNIKKAWKKLVKKQK